VTKETNATVRADAAATQPHARLRRRRRVEPEPPDLLVVLCIRPHDEPRKGLVLVNIVNHPVVAVGN
jgi:hypothetical protein